ncbi:MAG: hypothetical protein IPK44_01600 [Candidatus Accumulibacter sp.]|uniref:hypothetical protein n=1 Tax=Accumulibacter sp. TaxID=2053492 RepID=UPI00258A3D15|nr:hypothetical protein [Accumulibacter sp.]MBK8113295.1 hypothetical protein [Accumulibacter sp.]
MKTVVIQIGNSDDRLTQGEWSSFFVEIDRCLQSGSRAVHFRGTSEGTAPWQNACLVVSVEDGNVQKLLAEVAIIRETYLQDSVAALVGNVEMI